ncbi:MAG: DUF1549 domain-containing protein, partial [Bryobacteraceae bacterium]
MKPIAAILLLSGCTGAQVFSGPQPGEPLPPFKALAVNGPDAGREVDFIARYGDAPILLLFAHYMDRNVYRVWWPCERYAAEVPALKTLYVYLGPDRVEGERLMRGVVKSLNLTVPVTTSIDGVEGPGAYGLNKQVGVTAIIAKGGRVVYNRAIVQPGQSEAQKIIGELVKMVGGKAPTDLELARGPVMRRLPAGAPPMEQVEEVLGKDSADLASVLVRLTLPGIPEAAVNSTIRDLRVWAGNDAARKRHLVKRMPEILRIVPDEGARAKLTALAAEFAPAESGVDFATRVQPMLVKAGCFSGACHGAGSGQKGFKLSLLGYDPHADYEAFVYQYRGRRINLVNPEGSLVVQKGTHKLAHGGGPRFAESSETYRTLLTWIRDGAPYEAARKRRMVALEFTPSQATVARAGGTIALKLSAKFSDGSVDDVTQYALYNTNDEGIAKVDETGGVTVHRPGETGVSARYLGRFATARVGMPFEGAPAEVERATAAGSGVIDRLLNEKLRRLRLLPSPVGGDAEFLRRAHLDITGTIPTAEQARAFLADRSPGRRARLVEKLLARPEYAEYWTLWLLDLMRLSSKNIGEKNVPALRAWLIEQLRADAPFSEITRALLTTGGGANPVTPGVHYQRSLNNPKLLAELTTEAFLGSRSRCAACHDHPFDSWTQTQYHRFASFFVRIIPADGNVTLSDHGEIEHPKTGKPVTPGFPDDTAPSSIGEDRRPALAAWLVSSDNRYFGRSFANRVWARMMGRGLIEPVDDLSVSNAPTNPALLDALTRQFQDGYSLKSFIGAVASSEAYQRTAAPNAINASDDRFYSRALAAPLNAYQFADAIAQVTSLPNRFGRLEPGVRAIEVADPHTESYLLDVCGRCLRDGSCDAPNIGAGGIRQMLHLINGAAINEKIAAPGSRLAKLRERGATPAEIIEEFYLAALG